MKDIEFGEIRSKELFDKLATVRYNVFVDELKRNYPNEFISYGKLIEPIDKSSKNFVLLKNNTIIGGVRTTILKENPSYFLKIKKLYLLKNFHLNNGVYFSKLFITPPDNRNKRYLPFFFANLYLYLKSNKISFAIFNTNSNLIKLYEKIGFSCIPCTFYLNEVNKHVIPMLAIFDENYIKNCLSSSYRFYIKDINKK